MNTVTGMAPGIRFLPAGWRAEAPFQCYSSDHGLTAGARTPSGSFGVAISPASTPVPALSGATTHSLPGGSEVLVDSEQLIQIATAPQLAIYD